MCNLIHSDQIGFIKGKENISKIILLVDLTKENHIPAVLVLIDF